MVCVQSPSVKLYNSREDVAQMQIFILNLLELDALRAVCLPLSASDHTILVKLFYPLRVRLCLFTLALNICAAILRVYSSMRFSANFIYAKLLIFISLYYRMHSNCFCFLV